MHSDGSLNYELKKEILVLVKPEYRVKNLQIVNWLLDSVNSIYVILQHSYFPADGEWNHTTKNEIWAVVFEDDEASFLFKMTWG